MLLLCSTLGDESSRPLSYAQFRTLAERARALGPGGADLRRDLTAKDLTRLGYAPEEAERIEDLLSREAALHAYLSAAERRSIFPLTRITPGYPAALRALLGDRAPLVLFLRGEPSLLEHRGGGRLSRRRWACDCLSGWAADGLPRRRARALSDRGSL